MSVVEVEGLTKTFRPRFSGRPVEAVKGLDLTLDPGSVVAFVGPNGAGKTTTLLAILGFLKPDAGRISVFGEPAGSLAARRRLGFQFIYTRSLDAPSKDSRATAPTSGPPSSSVISRLPGFTMSRPGTRQLELEYRRKRG